MIGESQNPRKNAPKQILGNLFGRYNLKLPGIFFGKSLKRRTKGGGKGGEDSRNKPGGPLWETGQKWYRYSLLNFKGKILIWAPMKGFWGLPTFFKNFGVLKLLISQFFTPQGGFSPLKIFPHKTFKKPPWF